MLPRCSDYITRGLKYLKEKELIVIQENPDDTRSIIIIMTDKGRDAQRMLLTLYNLMGLKIVKI